MNFLDALKKLGIESYADRIYNSNSHGELFHILDYISLAEFLDYRYKELFAVWFNGVVRHAELTCERPESVFQHILILFKDGFDGYRFYSSK